MTRSLPPFPTFCIACLLGLGFLLTACQKQESPPAAAPATEKMPPAPVVVQDFLPLKVEAVRWQHKATKCKVKACAEVQADFVRFPDSTVLSTLVEQQMVALALPGAMMSQLQTAETFAHDFLRHAGAHYRADLRAKVLRQAGPLVALELAADLYTGGAHGNPSSRYLNYSRRDDRIILLDDVVIDGQRPALVQKLYEAHAAWRKQQGLDASWPFKETDNFTLAPEGLRFKYAAYDIAPYAFGQPELLLPYDQLKGIIRPEWVLPSP